jgi:hypothetical protein
MHVFSMCLIATDDLGMSFDNMWEKGMRGEKSTKNGYIT